MGNLIMHNMLIGFNVDEAIETLPLGSKDALVTGALIAHAPKAYEGPGVSLQSVWNNLPTDVQEALNAAADREYPDLDELD